MFKLVLLLVFLPYASIIVFTGVYFLFYVEFYIKTLVFCYLEVISYAAYVFKTFYFVKKGENLLYGFVY